MKHVISVVNLKGGVGKTTTAVNLAACWGEQGKKVLLVDLDPQGSASICVGGESDGTDILNAMQRIGTLPVASTNFKGLDLVPSGPELATARQVFIDGPGDEIFRSCLNQTSGDWDCVVIDCPPSLDVLTMSSLMACNHVVVPVEASFLGLNGLKQMVAAVNAIKSRNEELNINAVIPCRAHPRRRIHWEIMGRLEEMFPGKISPIIHENVSLAEAPGRGKPVIFTSSISRGSDDYRLVSLWLAERLGLEEEEKTEYSDNNSYFQPFDKASSL